MPDEIDRQQELNEVENAAHVEAARRSVGEIPPGVPGVCRECGGDSKRLVGGRCAPCRDGRA